MAGNNLDEQAAEVAELQTLLAQVQTPGNKRDLEQLLKRKQKLLKPQQEAPVAPVEASKPKPEPVKAPHALDELTTFTEISRFGWEDDGYGKEKVSVYVMSGIDGVGSLPKEQVTCHFTKTSFDLQIVGLGNKNYRLLKPYLEKEIDPSKSSFRVKKNRVTILLFKKDKNQTWMNLTAKNPGKSSKPDSSDPAAGIMDMMKNMYDEGDDEMKRTIAKAWSESRNKTDADGAAPF